MKKRLIIVLLLSFFGNCQTSFYGYKISDSYIELKLDVKKTPSVKKKFLFLTDGYLDILSDLLVRRGHSVTTLPPTEENLSISNEFDTIVIFKSRRYNTQNIKNDFNFSPFFFVISFGIIPYYEHLSNDYQLIIINSQGKRNIDYSLKLKRLTGWLLVPVYFLRKEEEVSIIPTIESNLLLCTLLEEK